MSCPPHPPRLYNYNYTWRRVQIMKLLESFTTVTQIKCLTHLSCKECLYAESKTTKGSAP
jgi:hypothetical protein